MSGAILYVPPLLAHLSGPPGAVVALAGVAARVNAPLRVVDGNARWLHAHTRRRAVTLVQPSGDQAKPAGGFSGAKSAWWRLLRSCFSQRAESLLGEHPEAALTYDHDAVVEAARRLSRTPWGDRTRQELEGPRPAFFAVTVLWSGQLVAALAASLLARAIWPGIPVVWGGAHVTALAPEIANHLAYGACVDGFVAGYAEKTFEAMLTGPPLDAPGVFRAGQRRWERALGDAAAPGHYGDLSLYGVPRLSLPAWTGRGCAYGKCAFCTYPAVEGAVVDAGLAPLDTAVTAAVRAGADVSLKDALVLHPRLDAVAARVAGRVRWSACTRIVPAPPRQRLEQWVCGGLRTLELGVESLDPATLRHLAKRQPLRLLDAWLEAAAGLDVVLVLNAMFGFPEQAPADVIEQLGQFEALHARFPRTRFVVEKHWFQLERRAPMAQRPEAFGIRGIRTWPWASVLGWEAPAWRRFIRLGDWWKEAA